MANPSCERCGVAIPGASTRRRFCSDACRAATFRSTAKANAEANANATATVPVDVEEIAGAPGRARAGLDSWLEEGGLNAPELLAEAARALADEVDRAPRNSPLWGRYLDSVRQLVEVVEALGARSRAVFADLATEFASREQAEAYRAERYRAAETDAERRRWERLVPIGCAEDNHRYIEWSGGRVTCGDCGAGR